MIKKTGWEYRRLGKLGVVTSSKDREKFHCAHPEIAIVYFHCAKLVQSKCGMVDSGCIFNLPKRLERLGRSVDLSS